MIKIRELIPEANNVYIDIVKRNMKVDGKYVIKDGEVKDGYEICQSKLPVKVVFLVMEEYYTEYKYSIPSKGSDSRYFPGLAFEDIPDDILVKAQRRNKAKAQLEYFVLESILNGSLTWNNEIMGGTFFWKSKKQPDLVLYKNWITN